MSSTTSNVSPRQDTYWWQGSVMEMKARAEDTGGALGVLEGRFFEEGYGPPHACAVSGPPWQPANGHTRATLATQATGTAQPGQ
jgi:hypothetical protein